MIASSALIQGFLLGTPYGLAYGLMHPCLCLNYLRRFEPRPAAVADRARRLRLWHGIFAPEAEAEVGTSVTGRRLSIPLLRYPIAEHLLLYGVGARPPPDGVR